MNAAVTGWVGKRASSAGADGRDTPHGSRAPWPVDTVSRAAAERRGVNATETVRAYYDALRAGDPLGPFFADGEPTVKYGISERLVGRTAVVAGLADQTATTTDWTVESRALRVTERASHAWTSDEVRLAWTDADGGRYDYETRWSGTLERRSGSDTDTDTDTDTEPGTGAELEPNMEPEAGTRTDPGGDADEPLDTPWRFVAMHVSVARDLEAT
jgi:hypothetical protein